MTHETGHSRQSFQESFLADLEEHYEDVARAQEEIWETDPQLAKLMYVDQDHEAALKYIADKYGTSETQPQPSIYLAVDNTIPTANDNE